MIKKDSEKIIEKTIRLKVEKLGGKSYKFISTNNSGVPDRLIILPGGKIAFVEVKSTGEKPRKLQEVIIGRLRALGCKVYVIDRLEQIDGMLEEIGGSNGI